MEHRNGDLECLLLDKTQQPVLKRGFIIYYILFIQFMENLSFMGLSSVLEILLPENLQYSENAATKIVHVVLMGEFFASFAGSIPCDGFVGKYKGIFIFGALELTGEALLLLLACIPNVQLQNSSVCQAFLLFALMMISLGHGSALPCLATFGGDEVRQEAKLSGDVVESRRCVTPTQQFFSAFFLSGMIATISGSIVLPVVRDQSKGSYFVVFLVVPCSKTSGIIVFWLGGKEYSSVSTVSTAPGLNGGPDVLADANTSSIQLVTKHSILSKKISREDWTLLTPANVVMLPKTLFDALHSQVISTWVHQARQMDRRVSGLTIPPDVMPTVAALAPVPAGVDGVEAIEVQDDSRGTFVSLYFNFTGVP